MEEDNWKQEDHCYMGSRIGSRKVCIRGCLGLLCSTFFSSAPCFLAKQFQLHVVSSMKKRGVVRAPKEVL